jgi:hypothetical protein
MNQQTDIDFTDKQPTALMRLEAVVNELQIFILPPIIVDDYHKGFDTAIELILTEIEQLKPSELADLKQSFCEGGIETESAETWAKKWKQTEL